MNLHSKPLVHGGEIRKPVRVHGSDELIEVHVLKVVNDLGDVLTGDVHIYPYLVTGDF